MTSGRRVCVIGGQGALGRAVAEDFGVAGWAVHPAGRRPDGREGYRRIDLDRPETVAAALKDVDLAISTVADPGFAAERCVLEHGGVLVNCSHAASASVARLGSEIRQPKGTVLLNGGLVPGVANLAAAELLERHPEADCLEIAFTILREGTAGRAGGKFVHGGLTSQAHHRVLSLPMSEHFGRLACIEISEGEDLGYAGVAGSREVRVYLGFGDRPIGWALRALNALRLMRLLPSAAFAVSSAGGDPPSREPTAIWLGARLGGERLCASLIECEGDYRTTAAAARAFAERLAADGRPGCFDPQDLFNLDDVAAPLRKIGVRLA